MCVEESTVKKGVHVRRSFTNEARTKTRKMVLKQMAAEFQTQHGPSTGRMSHSKIKFKPKWFRHYGRARQAQEGDKHNLRDPPNRDRPISPSRPSFIRSTMVRVCESKVVFRFPLSISVGSFPQLLRPWRANSPRTRAVGEANNNTRSLEPLSATTHFRLFWL